MRVRHFFIPHTDTHKKAHLLSFRALLIYILFFLVLQFGLKSLSSVRPEILGINSAVNQQELISLTNTERQKNGLPTLTEDSRLNAAAAAKAKNMLEENYWAHYSPSGKDPWGFIQGSGYRFTYAGENLARNFYNSPEVMAAWMASPTHRDNVLSGRYKNIGIAVMEGNLNGQDTILVVQEFGAPYEALASLPVATPTSLAQPSAPVQGLANVSPSPTIVPSPASTFTPLPTISAIPVVVASEQLSVSSKVDPYLVLRYVGLGFLFGMFLLILLDLYVLRRRAVLRLSGRHLPHLALISVAASALANMTPGEITTVAVSIAQQIK